jgi:hypothetical protein
MSKDAMSKETTKDSMASDKHKARSAKDAMPHAAIPADARGHDAMSRGTEEKSSR